MTMDWKSELQSTQERTWINRIENGREIQKDQDAPRFRVRGTAEIVKETQKSSFPGVTTTVGVML